MEAPSRGMLRRPIGLLPSATTRAERMPESIGHVSVQVMPAAEQIVVHVISYMHMQHVNMYMYMYMYMSCCARDMSSDPSLIPLLSLV